MARKFNNPQSTGKKQAGSYTSPSSRHNKIQKDSKKDGPKSTSNISKPTQPSTQTVSSQKVIPPPPVNLAQNKLLSEAGKTNLAKLASINKLMGVNIATTSVKTGK